MENTENKTNEKLPERTDDRLINIGKKTFISVLIMLFALVAAAIALTYVLPKGAFGTKADGTPDYDVYVRLENASGINVFKGIFAPVLILAGSDGLNVIMLSLFLVIISGAFQVMNDVYGIKSLVNVVVNKFRNRKFLLLAIVSLVFMAFGAFLGLFEEMLTLLPIIAILTVSLGLDSFTGFLVSIVACGFGFSSAITNPFTVIFASNVIGVNPMTNVWYRIIIFAVTYALLMLYVFAYVRKISAHPEKSLTFGRDETLRGRIFGEVTVPGERRIRTAYSVFFAVILATIIICSAVSAVRDYTIPFLIVMFLFGGIICGLISVGGKFGAVMKSFLKGVLSALPSVAFILLASSIKYVLEEGRVLPTIANEVNGLVTGGNVFLTAFTLYLIIVALEFFISSSTAKAVFVMSILSVLTLGINKEMLVLVYTFADGYTNLLFPTSPVLLIGLSMIGVSYFKWLKKSSWLFLLTAVMVAGFIALGLIINY
ncbi:MAG: hypothetical protein J6Z34_00460 [Clostridia bacterium]|nr:hypothetical protein [Clostridia bacterium]